MLRTIWLVMLITGIVLFVFSIVLLIVFKTFSLIGELSGKTAKKQVEKLKKLNVNARTTGNLIIDTNTGDIEEDFPIKEFSLSNITESKDSKGGEEATSYMDVNEEKTTYIEDSNNTTYMSSNDRTSFMEDFQDCESTTFIDEDYKNVKIHLVVLLQEQTSLELS